MTVSGNKQQVIGHCQTRNEQRLTREIPKSSAAVAAACFSVQARPLRYLAVPADGDYKSDAKVVGEHAIRPHLSALVAISPHLSALLRGARARDCGMSSPAAGYWGGDEECAAAGGFASIRRPTQRFLQGYARIFRPVARLRSALCKDMQAFASVCKDIDDFSKNAKSQTSNMQRRTSKGRRWLRMSEPTHVGRYKKQGGELSLAMGQA